ncbi:MAG: L-threonylcarbamoyladenylate synthase [Ilumatobacter sp.]|uniref:L-threonylcarbamoyladenylate synthase n=1 Tax=Ilumatobacter sp. TaxID=1967498 RepID=UPI003C784EA9
MTRRLIRDDLAAAVAALQAGGLVAMPTETVYGLAADATDPAAIARIFEAKGRPADHPLIVHLADGSDLDRWAPTASRAARALAATCWPGPLTLIVPRSALLPAAVAGGRDTVGLRVPAHPLARELIRSVGVPLAAPSANRFGAVSPTTAAHVRQDLGDAVDVVLDGGACPVGVESTIVDTTVDPVQILRAGAITEEQVASVLDASVAATSGPARASGMLASHYAPSCQVRLVDSVDDAVALAAGTPRSRILDLTADIAKYARELYAELRRADDDGVATLIAVLPDAVGLGHAVRDRLTKAAAPR